MIFFTIIFLKKLPHIANKADKVEHFMKLSLKNLKMDYVDLYLIHVPIGFNPKHDMDLLPVDELGKPVLDMKTNLVEVWKVVSISYIHIITILLN